LLNLTLSVLQHATGARASPGAHYQGGGSRTTNYSRQMELNQPTSPTVSPPPFPSTPGINCFARLFKDNLQPS